MDTTTLLDPDPHTTAPAALTGSADTTPTSLPDGHPDALAEGLANNLAEDAAVYAEDLAAAEAEAHANGMPVDLILRHLASRPDGTLDLERLARIAVVAALRIDQHLSEHFENPVWERGA